MADKTPGEIEAGVASRGSKVHATQADNTLSRSHTEEDISRLQSAIHNFNAALAYEAGDMAIESGIILKAKTAISAGTFDGADWDILPNIQPFTFDQSYNIGDLVIENNILYICKVAHVEGSGFNFNDFRLVNVSNLFAAETVGPLPVSGKEFISYVRSGGDDSTPVTILGHDISRSRSAVQPYLDTNGYEVGDLVLFNDLTYRNITAIGGGGETFDIDKWIPVGGVGSKNVKHIFTAADFPPVVSVAGTPMHPLDTGTHYIIAGTISIDDPLLVDAGFEVTMSTFAKEINFIEYTGSGALFRSRNLEADFGPVASGGGGELTFTAGNTLGLAVDDFVNILSGDGTNYTQIRAVVTAVDNNVSFNIAGSFGGSSVGTFDRNPKVLELTEVKFEGEGDNNFIDLSGTNVGLTEFYMFHCELENFVLIGSLENFKLVIFQLNELEEMEGPLALIDIESFNIFQNKWADSVAGSSNSNMTVDGVTVLGIITDNTFDTSVVADAALEILSTLDQNSRILIKNNADTRGTSTTLFYTAGGGLNETDKKLLVKDNTDQPDSITGCAVNSTSSFTTTIGTISTLTPLGSANWDISTDSQRMELRAGPIGQVFLNAEETTHVLVTYSIVAGPAAGNALDMFSGIILNGTPQTDSIITIPGVPTTEVTLFSGSLFLKLDPGDDVELGIGNDTNTDNISISSAHFSVVSIN